MTKVIITEQLFQQIKKNFDQAESAEIIDLLETLEKQPQKGKQLASVSGIIIKELKYKKFRFYFITDGHVLKFGSEDEIVNLLIKFVRMSEKKNQQKVIEEIKKVLKSLGFDAF